MSGFKTILIVILLAIVAALVWMLYFSQSHGPLSGASNSATSTSENTTPTASSTPHETPPKPLSSRVKVSAPLPNTSVPRTFNVTGEAPGPWYFEASFPVQVRTADGELLASTPAQAQSDWMTEAQVPFKATLTVYDYSGPATLVLLKDNPSGLPENDDSISFPITIGK